VQRTVKWPPLNLTGIDIQTTDLDINVDIAIARKLLTSAKSPLLDFTRGIMTDCMKLEGKKDVK